MISVNKSTGEVVIGGMISETLTPNQMKWFLLYTTVRDTPQELVNRLYEVMQCK